MAVLSKVSQSLFDILAFLTSSNEKKINSVAIIGLIFVLVRLKTSHKKHAYADVWKGKSKKKGRVNMDFVSRLMKILKIVIPTWRESVIIDLISQTGFLVLRTYLSIYIASVNGSIVKTIVSYDFPAFIQKITSLVMLALPASFVNSYLDYINKIIALKFRNNLTKHFHKIYIKDMIYYQLTNIDSRIRNPDQRIANDIEKWATSLSKLYSNITKPLLDMILFSIKLSEFVSWKGPALCIAANLGSGFLMKLVAPSFGKLRAIEQILEGKYRSSHTDLIHFSEEIAFLNGEKWEKRRVNGILDRLLEHLRDIMNKRLFMGTFDHMFVKYGATLTGYAVLGLPVFGAGAEDYLKKMKSDPSGITRDFIRNSSLLVNMSKVRRLE